MAGAKKLHEVSGLKVHKIVSFLNYGRHDIKLIKFCPKCFMPNLVGSGGCHTKTVICDTCDAMWLNPDKDLMELPVSDYLLLIKTLPLLNHGKMVISLQERLKKKDTHTSYDDLTEEELHHYDELTT